MVQPHPAATHRQEAPPAWCLRFLNGALVGRTLALRTGIHRAGSAGECEIVLPQSDLLPQHMILEVGKLAVSVQRVGAAEVHLNGEALQQARRRVMAGDVLRMGLIELQLDQVMPAEAYQDSMFVGTEGELPAAGQEPAAAAAGTAPAARTLRTGAGLAVVLAALIALPWASSTVRLGQEGAVQVGIQAVQQALQAFPEAEVVAGADGGILVRGYVESRARRETLRQSLLPFGAAVRLSVVSAEELLEQARRFVGDPAVDIAYKGQGRLELSGTVEGDHVRGQIRRLGEDMYPLVLVSDRVVYQPRSARQRDDGRKAGDADARAKWDALQDMLPARMVGITEHAGGMSHIQLSNGTRYYAGSVLRSGTELRHIDSEGLVLKGGGPPGSLE